MKKLVIAIMMLFMVVAYSNPIFVPKEDSFYELYGKLFTNVNIDKIYYCKYLDEAESLAGSTEHWHLLEKFFKEEESDFYFVIVCTDKDTNDTVIFVDANKGYVNYYFLVK